MGSLQGTVPSDQEVAKAVAGVTERHLEEKRKEERRRRREQEREAKEDKRWGVLQESLEMPTSDRAFLDMLHEYIHQKLNIWDESDEVLGVKPRTAVKKVEQCTYTDEIKDEVLELIDFMKMNPNTSGSKGRMFVAKRYFYEQFLARTGREPLDTSIHKVCSVMKSMGIHSVRRNNVYVWVFGKR